MAKKIIRDRIFNDLEKIMKEKDISGKTLSLKSGLSQSEISNIKNGKKIPSQSAILQLCMALQMQAEEVFELRWENVNFIENME